MTAGSGIVHSERMPPEQAHERCVNHGLQLWRALPEAHEEDAAFFVHTSASAIRGLAVDGATVRVPSNSALLGDGAYDATVKVVVPTFQRELTDKDLWSKPVHANFHFKLMNGKLTEVSASRR